ncbi:MAG: DUF533 domain-containing protein [Dechloromonas sp.]|uniref:DUF533 domain-containing protein n=1 Tax=Candidatus Dechloromonas phosphorivorans TaxID=2899244 RepID=A0A9D7QMZ9_9RHOO|nr:DUF533 domain-containing protein [Candidatus Dechloromonas phosphorivorans]
MNSDSAILAISLFAAFADGSNDDREREHIRRFAESMGADAPDLPRLYQDILFKRITLADAAKALDDLGQRQFAYEMAVCVCDADGVQGGGEKKFLAELKALLGLASDAQSTEAERQADSLAASAATLTLASGPVVTATAAVNEGELDKSILNYAILNGALELLPQSWASVAIIPLQIKMVYRIGKTYGHELDQGHIREFLATVGVGLTSQYLEQFGRKLLGGLLGKVAGKTVGRIGSAATGIAFSFASTYALGQVAKRYYAGGRQMSAQLLQDSFQNLLGPAKQLQSQYLPQIQQKAKTLDAGQIMAMVGGKGL